MTHKPLDVTVRQASPFVNIIDINGEIGHFSEKALSEAFAQASEGHIRKIILNFTDMKYMNSFGIGMLVTLLIRAQRENKKLVAYGLSDHYRKIFELARLDQVIPLFETEGAALAASERYDLPERES